MVITTLLRKHIVLFVILGIVSVILAAYVLVFGRALRQNEHHFAIACAIPKALVGGDVVPISDDVFLSPDSDSFLSYMSRRSFFFIDQMGSTYFFEREGVRYLVTSSMYSRYFMIFHVFPEDRE